MSVTQGNLDEIWKKLNEVTTKQAEYKNKFLEKLKDASQACVSDAACAQGLMLDDINNMIYSIKFSIEQLAESVHKNERHLDDLEQYGRNDCLFSMAIQVYQIKRQVIQFSKIL